MSMAVSKAVMGATFDDMVENTGKCWGCTVTTAVEQMELEASGFLGETFSCFAQAQLAGSCLEQVFT